MAKKRYTGLAFGEELQDLTHEPLTLWRLKNELRVGRPVEDHELLRAPCSLVLVANPRKSQGTAAAGVASTRNEQFPTLHPLWLLDWRVCQQHDAVDLAGWRLHRRLGRSPSAEAGADDRYRLCAGLMQVSDRGQHIELNSVVTRRGLWSAARPAASSEIDGHDAESSRRQCARLRRPTLLGEPPAVCQHHAAIAGPVHVRVDNAPVLGRKGHTFLWLADA